jgi:nicotinate phosphoribosyltransferase
VLLIDTYNTERAAHKVVALAPKLAAQGIAIKGVRIDSGDLAQHARRVRSILDAAGLTTVTIFASGNLDEHRVQELVRSRAPIDGFGIGTRMNTSADAPFLDCAYKLEEYEGRPRRKRSEGKATWPGRKQVLRRYDDAGRFAGDVLALAGDAVSGTTLLQRVLRGGRMLGPGADLTAARARVKADLERLPRDLRSLEASAPYVVEIAPSLRALAGRLDAQD